jgi:TrmH family RNA methyltransferase
VLSKNEAKYIQSLGHKKQRQEEGLFIAEGVKLVEELLKTDYRIRKLYATEEWIREHQDSEAQLVTGPELERISGLVSPNQVLAIVEQKKLLEKPVLKQQFTIALDGIQDPGNLGTIIRIADWFGIRNILAGEDTVELYNPKVIQATMGSFTRVNLWYGSLERILPEAHMPVFGAVLDGKDVRHADKAAAGILLIGNEGKGIRPALLPCITHPVTIPRAGGAESLNAAVATGIIISHLITT